MSIETSSAFQLKTRARRLAKRIPAAALLWRLLRKARCFAPYYITRLLSCITYPILRRRAPLRGYYVKTRDYLRAGNGHLIELRPSLSTGATSTTDSLKQEIFTAVIPRARTLSDRGVIVSPDHRLLADVSWEGYDLNSEPKNHPAMYKLYLPPTIHIAGRVAVVTSIKAENYYHWMFDILPRFDIIQKSGLRPDYYVVNANTRFQKESLEILNIAPDQLLNPTADTHIVADELVIPSLLGPVFLMSPQRQACEYLRSRFLPRVKARKAHRALYITRDDARDRRVTNEVEIRAEVTSLGFEVVSLSNVPVLQQVELFSEASIIVGPHGAGFTNAVFCPPNAVLIEFIPEKRRLDCFERLARFVGMRYHSIVGTERGVPQDRLSSDDHAVDVTALSRLLRQFA